MSKVLIKNGSKFECVELNALPTNQPVTIVKAEVNENHVDLELLNKAYALGYNDGVATNPFNGIFQDISKGRRG